tara:strand:+ start:2186 stop:2362 length:177 start_codon:yes stop_codon:yes gene_type:complete
MSDFSIAATGLQLSTTAAGVAKLKESLPNCLIPFRQYPLPPVQVRLLAARCARQWQDR